MAKLKLENGEVLTDTAAIQSQLAPLGVELKKWPVARDQEWSGLLDKPALEDAEKEAVLGGLDHYFQQLKDSAGYTSRDIIVLHDKVPGLGDMLTKFDKCHTHADDEVRYVVDGEGVFGFVTPDGKQMSLTVEAEDYINVPKNTEHWFHLTDARRIKCVRYFSGTDGWTPEYTGTERRL